jgi:hypothetical protein
MEWSRESISTLIEMYKRLPVLWNVKCEDYKNRNKKHDAWQDISEALNIERVEVEKKIRV